VTGPTVGTVTAVCVGRVRPLVWRERTERTAIDKRPVDGRIHAAALGLEGDEQGDRQRHGGVDKAVYAYGQGDADRWQAQMRRELPPGAFGENLRVAGIDVSAARVGERWRIGDEVVVEVSAPRIPCRVFAAFWDVPDLVARFIAVGRPGAYLRVVEEGCIGAGDAIEVIDRPAHQVTVAHVMRVRTTATDDAASLLAAGDDLPEETRSWVEARLAG